MNDIMQRMRENLRTDWKVFGVLAFLHTALARHGLNSVDFKVGFADKRGDLNG